MTDIMNASLSRGTVLSEWENAIVVPVPKVTPTPSMDKLRPVSLICTLANVCETFLMRWMMQDMGPSLDSAQFGNRKGRPTSQYLVDLLHYVVGEVELGRYVNILMIDYSKVFDKVDIRVAMGKLLVMQVRPELLIWIGDFLSGRQQCVKHGGTLSELSGTKWRSSGH